jgi:hypothetical protein
MKVKRVIFQIAVDITEDDFFEDGYFKFDNNEHVKGVAIDTLNERDLEDMYVNESDIVRIEDINY